MNYVISVVLFLTSILCSAQTTKDLIFDSQIKYPNIAYAISSHETGNFTSKLYKNKNNLYGFRKGKSYASYPSKNHSIQAYIKFEERMIKKYNVKSSAQYLKAISRIYAKDPKWLNRVKSHL